MRKAMNGPDIDSSASPTNQLNLNRAICNAAGAAEAIDLDDNMSNSGMMQAIHLKEYVKSINDITPVLMPKPTFTSFLSSSKKPINESLIHVKITHTAINHVDLLYAQGRHQNNHSGLFKPPFTLGLEFSGIVLATQNPPPPPSSSSTTKSSSNAHQQSPPHFKPGDHVWGGSLGTHAEEIIVPQSALRYVPHGWSLHDITGLGAATAPVSYGALVKIANLRRGETILIHAAAGGLGVIAVQIARALGAKVIATVGSEAKAKIIRDLLLVDPTTGAKSTMGGEMPPGEGVINYNLDKEWHKTVLALTSQTQRKDHDEASSSSSSSIPEPSPGAGAGAGVDVVYDTVGLVAQSIRCTRFNGRIIIAGFAGRTGLGSSPSAALESIPTNRILLKQVKLLGYRFGETSRRLPHETVRMWTGLTEMLERREVRPVVYRTWKGLDSGICQGMQALGDREVYGKAVVEVCPVEEAERYVEQQQQQQQRQGETKERREGRRKADAKL